MLLLFQNGRLLCVQEHVNIELHQINGKCALINLYVREKDFPSANKVLNSINVEDLSYQSKSKVESVKSRVEYISK